MKVCSECQPTFINEVIFAAIVQGTEQISSQLLAHVNNTFESARPETVCSFLALSESDIGMVAHMPNTVDTNTKSFTRLPT